MKPKAVVMIMAACLLAAGLRGQNNNTVQYFYDAAGRLTSVVDTSGNVSTYHYDAVGNLLSITRSSLPGSNGLAILGFAPTSGGVGTTVVIQGQGFNATPASDAVQFNGVSASVTAATNNTLTAIVPSGATTGPISVTVASSTVTSSSNFTVATLASINVTPSSATIAAPGTLSFTAMGIYSDNSAQNITAQVTWSSSDTTVATASNSAGSQGVVTGVGAGSITITATLGSANGSAAVQVTPPSSLNISPSSATVAQGATQQFTGIGSYSNGAPQNVTNFVTWSSSWPSSATVSNTPPTQGLVTVISSNHYASICATGPSSWGLAPACALLNATTQPLSLALSPANGSAPAGLETQFTAVGSLNNGNTADETTAALWSSSNPAVATIAPNSGLATPLSAGTTTITATVQGVSGSTTFTVTTPVPLSLTVTPIESFVVSGTSQQLKATAALNNGKTQDETTTATWSSSDSTIATVSNTAGSQGLVTGKGMGSATITATAGSASNSATVLVESAAQSVYPRFAYLGSVNTWPGRTEAASGWITIYTVDAATGQLRPNGYMMEAPGSQPYNLALDPSSKFLFAANSGANTISAYTVNATNGALTPVAGSPFASGGGLLGIVVDPTANYLYAVNSSDETVSAFAFDPNTGVLTAVPGSPFSVGVSPEYAAVDPGGKFLYVTDTNGQAVFGFTINPASGALTLISGSPYQLGTYPMHLTVDPSGQYLLVYTWEAAQGPQVSVFGIDATSGALTPVPGSPIATGGWPGSIVVDPTDHYVYVGEGETGTVMEFTLNSSNGALTAVPGTQAFLENCAIGCPVLSVDPSGRFLYGPTNSSVTAFGLSPGSGVLIELANFGTQYGMSNLVITSGTAAVQSVPQFAYVADAGSINGSPGSNNVWGFSIDPAAGGLSVLGSSPFAEGFSPTAVTSDRLGQFLFVANNCSDLACSASAGSVSAFIINPATGSLTAAPGSPFLAGVNPVGVVVDPSQQFVYVLNGGDLTVSAYALNSATGSLAPIAGSPFPITLASFYGGVTPPCGGTPATALSLAVDPLGNILYVGVWCGQYQYGFIVRIDISGNSGVVSGLGGQVSTYGLDPLAALIEPTEKYLYIATSDLNGTGSVVASSLGPWLVGPSQPSGGYPAGDQPSAIAVDPTGRFLYVANAGSGNISAFAIDPAGSGALTPIPDSPFATGANPVSLSVDFSGKFLYAVCQGDNTVWAYSIDQQLGMLTPTAGSPYPVGQLPVSITTTGTTQ